MPAESKKQQRFFGMVHAVQKGELCPKKVGPEIRKAAREMKYGDVKDLASTIHKNLPEKKGSLQMKYFEKISEVSAGQVIGAGAATGAAAGGAYGYGTAKLLERMYAMKAPKGTFPLIAGIHAGVGGLLGAGVGGAGYGIHKGIKKIRE